MSGAVELMSMAPSEISQRYAGYDQNEVINERELRHEERGNADMEQQRVERVDQSLDDIVRGDMERRRREIEEEKRVAEEARQRRNDDNRVFSDREREDRGGYYERRPKGHHNNGKWTGYGKGYHHENNKGHGKGSRPSRYERYEGHHDQSGNPFMGSRSFDQGRASRNSQNWHVNERHQADSFPKPRQSRQDVSSRRGSQWSGHTGRSGNERRKSLQERQDPRDVGNLPSHLIGPSRTLASFLRHVAGTNGYPTVDTEGFLAVPILSTVTFKGLHMLAERDIRTICAESYSKNRPRFELRTIEGELCIRATHNHSLSVRVRSRSRSPQRCFLRSRSRPRSQSRSQPGIANDDDNRPADMDVDAVGPADRSSPPVETPPLYTPPNAPPGMVDTLRSESTTIRVKQEILNNGSNKENEAPAKAAPPPTPPVSGASSSISGPKRRILHDYGEDIHAKGQTFRQLVLTAGEIVIVAGPDSEDGWAQAWKFDGTEGWYPTNYAEDFTFPSAPKAPPPVFQG